MVWAISTFLDFTYLVRRQVINEDALRWIKKTIENFHRYRKIFQTVGVKVSGFNLPRQHAVNHFPRHIQQFGAPNGLCSSISETNHKHTKSYYKKTNRVEPHKQMTKHSERMDKLAAFRSRRQRCGMLPLDKTKERGRKRKRGPPGAQTHDDQAGSDSDSNGETAQGHGNAGSASESDSDVSIDAHGDNRLPAVQGHRRARTHTQTVSSASTGRRHRCSIGGASSASSCRSRLGDCSSTSTLARTPGMYCTRHTSVDGLRSGCL